MKLILKSPLKYFHINQPFGANFNNFYKEMGMLGHNGLDLLALDSTEVYASHDGRVTFAGYDGAGGLGIVIRTEEKFDYFNTQTGQLEPSYFKTIYWHLKKDSLKVTGSQKVKAGDLIGLADNTGRSTGSHLHFGLKPIYRGEQDWQWDNSLQNNGYNGAIDPMPFFETKIDPKPLNTDLINKLNTSSESIEAIKKFQTKNGLVPDGIIGPKTREALMK